ncbi:HAD family hydrolase [Neptunomonas phycophila]|uniref:HAD family hydrolase n=1 Tax=Neptunomonas phycophila TaxID=1572645 RepID=UPI001BE9F52E|nr:HAD hydrolase-like protein [Neptunomonas phycophila]MBT3144314.1 HAD family hydrolase [Neptunomonas phycophila]
MNLAEYETLVFDCDGVILNSNKVKVNAFYQAALPYGEKAANALVDYHVERGGISRYKKFEWFLQEKVKGQAGPNLEELLEAYASIVREGLLTCEIAEGLEELREKTKSASWLIVSGGDQNELRDIFFQRELTRFFDGGIFGSPDTKDFILEREISSGNIKSQSLFLGDSKYDLDSAKKMRLDFMFVSDWSEWENSDSFQKFFKHTIGKLNELNSLGGCSGY